MVVDGDFEELYVQTFSRSVRIASYYGLCKMMYCPGGYCRLGKVIASKDARDELMIKKFPSNVAI